MLIFILVRSYLSPIISTASSSGCVSLSFFVDPTLLPPYTPCFHFLCVCFVSWWLLSLRLSLSLSLSLSLPPTFSLTLVPISLSAPFSIHPLWSLILQTSLYRCLIPFYMQPFLLRQETQCVHHPLVQPLVAARLQSMASSFAYPWPSSCCPFALYRHPWQRPRIQSHEHQEHIQDVL